MKDIIITAMINAIPSLVVGMLGAYLTAQKTIATIKNRLENAERRLNKIEKRQEERNGQYNEISEQLVKISTQQKLLLEDKIKNPEE